MSRRSNLYKNNYYQVPKKFNLYWERTLSITSKTENNSFISRQKSLSLSIEMCLQRLIFSNNTEKISRASKNNSKWMRYFNVYIQGSKSLLKPNSSCKLLNWIRCVSNMLWVIEIKTLARRTTLDIYSTATTITLNSKK